LSDYPRSNLEDAYCCALQLFINIFNRISFIYNNTLNKLCLLLLLLLLLVCFAAAGGGPCIQLQQTRLHR
jgi:hypothetical protein